MSKKKKLSVAVFVSLQALYNRTDFCLLRPHSEHSHALLSVKASLCDAYRLFNINRVAFSASISTFPSSPRSGMESTLLGDFGVLGLDLVSALQVSGNCPTRGGPDRTRRPARCYIRWPMNPKINAAEPDGYSQQ